MLSAVVCSCVFLLSLPRVCFLSIVRLCNFPLFHCGMGAVIFPHDLLAVVSNCVLGHCGFPIHWLSFPLSTLGVGFSFVWDCVSCPVVTLRNCVCCGLLISNLLVELSLFWDCGLLSLFHCMFVAAKVPWFWVAAELFWPR